MAVKIWHILKGNKARTLQMHINSRVTDKKAEQTAWQLIFDTMAEEIMENIVTEVEIPTLNENEEKKMYAEPLPEE